MYVYVFVLHTCNRAELPHRQSSHLHFETALFLLTALMRRLEMTGDSLTVFCVPFLVLWLERATFCGVGGTFLFLFQPVGISDLLSL